MQPLISPIDHESRTSSYHDEGVASESTPLLHRFPPPPDAVGGRSLATSLVIGSLLTLLLSGIVIGTYLLIEQGKEENVLPPVEQALQLVGRSQWDRNASRAERAGPLRARRLLAVQTDTEPCRATVHCIALLNGIMKNDSSALSHNFVVSSGGQSYEVRGWKRRSPMFPQYEDALVVGFIGNFTDTPPSETQIEEAKRLLDESVSQQYLAPNYTIIGKRTKELPTLLFKELKKLPQWDHKLSDM